MFFRCLSFFLLGCGFACAKELHVCAEPDNLPFSREDESGFENRIARLLADEIRAELSFAWEPQRRGFVRKTLGAGVCDVWIGVPSDLERVLTTRPYYRSTYVFIGRKKALASFDAPELKVLRIGVQLPGNDMAATPPGHALALRGAVDNVVGYTVYGGRPAAQRIVDAIANDELDAGVVWGPAAGYFAAQKKLAVASARPPAELAQLPFQFSISMGVRRTERALRDELDAAIERRQAEIDTILDEYAVPRLQ
jgi:mxaJ protein